MLGMILTYLPQTYFVEGVGDTVYESRFPSGVAVLRDGSVSINGRTLKIGEPSRIYADLPLPFRHVEVRGADGTISQPYRRVILQEAFPKTDVILTAEKGEMEIQFIVKPGGNPEDIVLSFSQPIDMFNFRAYQGAKELPIEPVFSGNVMRFSVEGYDPRYPLVIDPTIFLYGGGSSSYEDVVEVLDDGTYYYVVGNTQSPSTYNSGGQVGPTGSEDIFIVKYDHSWSLQTTVVIGTANYDQVKDAAVDFVNGGRVFLTGQTTDASGMAAFSSCSNTFGPLGNADLFVLAYNMNTLTMECVMLVGSDQNESGNGIAIHPVGSGTPIEVVVAGYTANGNGLSGIANTYGTLGSLDMLVAYVNFDPSTQQFDWTSFGMDVIGGAGSEVAEGLGVAHYSWGNYLIAGWTNEASFFLPALNAFTNNNVSTASSVLGSTDAVFVSYVDPLGNLGFTHTANARIIGSDMGTNDMGMDALWHPLSPNYSAVVVGVLDSANTFAMNFGATIYGVPSSYTPDVFAMMFPGGAGFIDFTASPTAAAVFAGGMMYDDVEGGFYYSDGTNHRIYISGSTDDPSGFAGIGGTTYGSTGGGDVYVLEIDENLTPQSKFVVAGPGNENSYGVLRSSTSEVIVFGRTDDGSNVGGGPSSVIGGVGSFDGFVFTDATITSVKERQGENSVRLNGEVLEVRLSHSAYVGYDLYSPDGRLVDRVSVGFLPPGTYRFPVKAKGHTYLLKVRVGDRVSALKGLR